MMSFLSATCILTSVFTYKQTIMVTNRMRDPFSNPPFAIRSILLFLSAFFSSCSVLMSWFKWSIDQFRRGEWRESAIVRQRKSRVIGLHHTPKSRAKGWAGVLGLKGNDSFFPHRFSPQSGRNLSVRYANRRMGRQGKAWSACHQTTING